MHGIMRDFELITARVRDAGRAGGRRLHLHGGPQRRATHIVLSREIAEIAAGQDADRIEWLWNRLWWDLHYGGRGGPTVLAISAFDMALWDLKASAPACRSGTSWAATTRACPAMPAARPGAHGLTSCLKQTDENLAKGFRAIKMKVGRKKLSEDVEKVAAMRRPSRTRVPADGGRQHEMERRRGDPRRPRLCTL
jgi:L-alanine-DL-glutamate epimerase-like enolase superfamily enzyme